MAEILFGMIKAEHLACYEIPRRGTLSVRCFAHILNLIVKEFLGYWGRIRNIHGYVHIRVSMGTPMNVSFTSYVSLIVEAC